MEATLGADAPCHGVVTTGTGSGKTESFLLPVLGRHAEEASKRPANFGERAVRALLLYPMSSGRTSRLDVLTHAIALALGGRPGERLAGRLSMPVTADMPPE